MNVQYAMGLKLKAERIEERKFFGKKKYAKYNLVGIVKGYLAESNAALAGKAYRERVAPDPLTLEGIVREARNIDATDNIILGDRYFPQRQAEELANALNDEFYYQGLTATTYTSQINRDIATVNPLARYDFYVVYWEPGAPIEKVWGAIVSIL